MSRTCIVLPTYNNGKTVGDVIRGSLAYVPDLIVVDDGSTDGTEKVLEGFKNITMVKHQRNQGKGAALMTGFTKARELGFDRAITIDADGQHLAGDIPGFLSAERVEPGTLFVGSRKRIGEKVAWTSRFANSFSDFWFWLESGAKFPDTQCGFRNYPLDIIGRLRLGKTHYDFEIEVLVKAAWLGTSLKAVPVTAVYLPPGQRVSHFRPIKDFLRISHLYVLFFFLRFFLPSGFQKIACDNSYSRVPFVQKLRMIAQDFFGEATSSPLHFSVSIGVGLLTGILPIWGIQTLIAALLADRLRLNKFAAVLASNISFPAAVPFIFYTALVLGHALLSGSLDLNAFPQGEWRQLVAQKFTEWFLGSLVLAVVVGVVGGALTYFFVRLINLFRGPVGNA